MNEVHNTNRINILKDVKTAVNTLFFAPSEQHKAEAKASIEALINFVDAIEMPKPKVSKPSVKKALPSDAVQPKADGMYELFQQFLALQGIAIAETSAPSEQVAEPKAKRPVTPRKPKASKPTKTRRPSRNEKLEAQAQKLSLKAAEDRAAKNTPKEVVVCDGKPTEASPFGTRRLQVNDEVAAAAKAAEMKRKARQAALAAQAKLLAEQEALAEATAEQLELFNDDCAF
jgi:hypothetical protein